MPISFYIYAVIALACTFTAGFTWGARYGYKESLLDLAEFVREARAHRAKFLHSDTPIGDEVADDLGITKK